MKRILFVCLGNICRSPMAEGVFRHTASARGLVPPVEVDSAGTGSWHIGNPPDERAQAAAASRGIDITAQRARQISTGDFDSFDLIIAMDRSNVSRLESLSPEQQLGKIRLFLDFAPNAARRRSARPLLRRIGRFRSRSRSDRGGGSGTCGIHRSRTEVIDLLGHIGSAALGGARRQQHELINVEDAALIKRMARQRRFAPPRSTPGRRASAQR